MNPLVKAIDKALAFTRAHPENDYLLRDYATREELEAMDGFGAIAERVVNLAHAAGLHYLLPREDSLLRRIQRDGPLPEQLQFETDLNLPGVLGYLPRSLEPVFCLKGVLHWKKMMEQLRRIAAQQAEPSRQTANGKEAPVTALLPMVSLGDRNYTVGDKIQVVEVAEDIVLQAFFRSNPANKANGSWIALDKRGLIAKSGYETAPRILKKIKGKYPILAPAIDCPGRKGQGGLKVFVGKPRKARKK